MVLILIAMMSLSFYLESQRLKADLIKNLEESSTHYLSDVIKGSLKHAMITRDPNETKFIIKALNEQKEVMNIFLVNKKGEIKVSPDSNDEGKKLDMGDRTCQICHRKKAEERSKTIIYQTLSGETIFRNVNPILNEPACYACHDPKDKVNGVLITDFSLAGIERQISFEMRGRIITLVFVTIGIVVAMTFMMNRMVLNKLQRFARATKLFSAGSLDERVDIAGEDEIGDLARSFNQMAEHLRRTREIRERKELLENVLNSVNESVMIMDVDGKIISVSRGTEQIFGHIFAELVGRIYPSLDSERARIWHFAFEGKLYSSEMALYRKNGEKFPAFLSLTALKSEKNEPVAFLEVVRDLTEEKMKERMQQQLIQSEKVAAVGRLAAGVAHELNNPLGNILLFSKLMLEDMRSEGPHAKHLIKIVDNSLRSKKIITDLLDFTRQSEIHMDQNNINELAEKSIGMLANELRINKIEHELLLDPDMPRIGCDKSQVQQVFINLIQNAAQSLKVGGKIWVLSKFNRAEKKAIFGIRDNGPGIPEESISKIFEPFYTTREKGTGLGLSICSGIIERHGGRIWVENNSKRRAAEAKTNNFDLLSVRISSEDDNRGCTFYVELAAKSE